MRDRDALREGWAEVIATRDSAPPDCPCRAVTAPLIAAWLTWDRAENTIDQQWLNLRAARAAQAAPGALAPRVGDFAIDVRTPAECQKKPREGAVNIPVDEIAERLAEVPLDARVVVYCASGQRARRAVHLLRERGYEACNGHEPVCEIPDTTETRQKESTMDPRMAGPADALMGVFSGLTQGLGGASGGAIGEAAKSAIPGVAAAVKGEVPGVAQTIKSEVPGVVAVAGEATKGAVPGVVQAAGSAARPVATSIAGEAGEAAGRGVAGGAKGAAAGMAPVVVVGVVAVVAAAIGIGYAASQKERKKS